MNKLLKCRRSMIALVGMACCTGIAFVVGVDTSGAVAAICMGVAGANAAQASMEKRNE